MKWLHSSTAIRQMIQRLAACLSREEPLRRVASEGHGSPAVARWAAVNPSRSAKECFGSQPGLGAEMQANLSIIWMADPIAFHSSARRLHGSLAIKPHGGPPSVKTHVDPPLQR